MAEEEEDFDEEEEEEEYPPWLKVVVDDEAAYWDEVTVLEPGGDAGPALKEWVEVKSILVPDTQEAATGKGPGVCRTYKVQRYSTILITSEPTTPPYIGLVDKVFRKRAAKKVRDANGKAVYRLQDFGVHAFWFYRPTEVPAAAWRSLTRLRSYTKGCAGYKLPDKARLQQEDVSERQVLFSSHHTLHDYPDAKGIQALDGLLQDCKVHWLGSTLPEVPRLEVHGSTLVSVQEPGFVVRGFLWCGGKNEQQLDADQKEAFKLEGKWHNRETREIVSVMCAEYKKQHEALIARNRAVLERFHAAKAAKQQTIPSDDKQDNTTTSTAAAAAGGGGRLGRPLPGKAGGSGSTRRVASPRLEGVDYDGAADGGGVSNMLLDAVGGDEDDD